MKQYQRHLEIADKLAAAGNFSLAISNIESLIRSARSERAIAFLNAKRKELISDVFFNTPTLQSNCPIISNIAESQGYDLS